MVERYCSIDRFKHLIKVHAAVKINNVHAIKDAPKDKAVWFETQNFGWLLSPQGATGEAGNRSILAQC